jgi:hypothetical protein
MSLAADARNPNEVSKNTLYKQENIARIQTHGNPYRCRAVQKARKKWPAQNVERFQWQRQCRDSLQRRSRTWRFSPRHIAGEKLETEQLAEREELGSNILHLELPEIQIASYRSAVVWWAFVEGGLGPNRRFQMGCRRVGVEPATFRL